MKIQKTRNAEVLSREVEYIETYWQQCRVFDSRPWDTSSIMGHADSQLVSQKAYAEQFEAIIVQQ